MDSSHSVTTSTPASAHQPQQLGDLVRAALVAEARRPRARTPAPTGGCRRTSPRRAAGISRRGELPEHPALVQQRRAGRDTRIPGRVRARRAPGGRGGPRVRLRRTAGRGGWHPAGTRSGSVTSTGVTAAAATLAARPGPAAAARLAAPVGLRGLRRGRHRAGRGRRGDPRRRGRPGHRGLRADRAACSSAPRAVYHRVRWARASRHALMARLDHSMIFVFIAGTYTPFALLAMPDRTGRHRARRRLVRRARRRAAQVDLDHRAALAVACRSTSALGWVAVFALPDLLRHGGVAAFVLLAAGGLLYTAGAIVYGLKRPDPWPRRLRLPRGVPPVHGGRRGLPHGRRLARGLLSAVAGRRLRRS